MPCHSISFSFEFQIHQDSGVDPDLQHGPDRVPHHHEQGQHQVRQHDRRDGQQDLQLRLHRQHRHPGRHHRQDDQRDLSGVAHQGGVLRDHHGQHDPPHLPLSLSRSGSRHLRQQGARFPGKPDPNLINCRN